MLRVTRKIALYLIVAIAVGLALDAVQQLYWRSRPASAFKALVGRLPDQVLVHAYGTCLTNGLLHRTYYWRLRGDSPALRQLAQRLGYVSASPDAVRMLPASTKCMAPLVSKDDVVEAYEQEMSRNHAYFLLRGEREALIAF